MTGKWVKIGTLFLTVLFFSSAVLAGANPQDQSPSKATIKKVPAAEVSPASGKAMFESYCAACHGTDGTGNGPAAKALKTPPANLTLLSSHHDGKFPDAAVQQAIKGDSAMPYAHGSKEMPVWGPVFSNMAQGNPGQAQLRVRNLADYISTLQKK